ncbi:MAG: hypothetical protein L6R28_07615 [Planctomycetes bacterium]|nr:hypothetical protein [Planctomycetota bacterium]
MGRSNTWLRQLEEAKGRYEPGSATRKLDLLRQLDKARLSSARQVLRLHQAMCFLRAFPDDPAILAQTEAMLGRFERRADLRRHRAELSDSGIVGTDYYYRYFWSTACWLAERCPRELSIDWSDFEHREDLAGMLEVLLPHCESPALDAYDYPVKDWLRRLKGPHETDAVFLVRRFQALAASAGSREQQYDKLDPPMRLRSGPRTPTTTKARYEGARVSFQRGPLSNQRLSAAEIRRGAPLAVRDLSFKEGRRFVDMARSAMVDSSRDLDAFANADARDVRLVDCPDGLQFAWMGVLPEYRLQLESLHGFLVLKNGVPVSYGAASTLFGTSEVAYSVFEAYRSAETSLIYGRWLGVVHHLLGSDTFVVDPYQLGQDNQDGLRSGAWWFYYKLGFRPVDLATLQIVRGELKRIKANSKHRSSLATLKELASENMYLFLGKPRRDVLGLLNVGGIGQRVSAYLAKRFGSDREAGLRACAHEAGRLLGLDAARRLNTDQQRAWLQWAPIVLVLPDVNRWTRAQKARLIRIILAKGGQREVDFVSMSNRHQPLWRALAKLATEA